MMKRRDETAVRVRTDSEVGRRRASTARFDDMLEFERRSLRRALKALHAESRNRDPMRISALIEDFSMRMTNYVALVRMGLFKRVTEGEERRASVLAIAQALLPEIERADAAMMAFGERYTQPDSTFSRLYDELAHLSSVLKRRLAAEDRVIALIVRR
jgi:regulator of sigma D